MWVGIDCLSFWLLYLYMHALFIKWIIFMIYIKFCSYIRKKSLIHLCTIYLLNFLFVRKVTMKVILGKWCNHSHFRFFIGNIDFKRVKKVSQNKTNQKNTWSWKFILYFKYVPTCERLKLVIILDSHAEFSGSNLAADP